MAQCARSAMNIKCEICEKTFTRKYCLNTHLGTHEKTRYKYPCAFCEKKLSNLFNLNNHYNRTHPNKNIPDFVPEPVPIEKGQKTPECDICGKTFSRIPNLKGHIYDVHLGIRKLGCDSCKKKWQRKKIWQKGRFSAPHQKFPS